MKVLITGNMGYVGPVLVHHLKKTHNDISITGFDSGFFSSLLIGTQVLPETLLKCQYFGDVRHFPVNILDGIDAIVYLAAISNDPMGNTFEAQTKSINQDQALSLAKEAKSRNVRSFIFASSCSMYGSAAEGLRTEDSELNPLTAYARSKVGAEEGLKALADNTFNVTSLRFATACGFSPRLRLDLVLNDFVASALTTGKIEILSDGTPFRPLIHVQDMARAIDWALQRDGENFLAINTGSNEWNYQIGELGEAVAAIIPNATVTINKNAAPDKRSYQVSFKKFASLAPHHQPQISLEEAVKELYHELQSTQFNDAGFRKSKYMRLVALSALQDSGMLDRDLQWQHIYKK